MQGNNIDLLYILLYGTTILLMFAIGSIIILAYSKRRIVAAEKSKLEEVSKSEKKYKGLFDNSLAGIIRFSIDDLRVIDANEAACAMLGCSTTAQLQAAIGRFPVEAVRRVNSTLAQDGYVGQVEIHTQDAKGKGLWLLFAAKTLDENGIAQGILVDITEQKVYEEQIKEQSALLDQAQDAFIVTDFQGTIRFWSAGAAALYGWSETEVVGKALVQIVYQNVELEQFPSALDELNRLDEWRGEHSHRKKDGKVVLVEGRWKTIRNAQSDERIILMVNRDITEKRRLEAQSQRALRAESIALLAGGLAHDLQNILAPVRMSARFLKNKVSGKSSQAVVKALEERAKSGLLLVKNILSYGKGSTIRRNRLDVNNIMNDVAALMMRRSKKKIEIKRTFESHLPCILGDASELKQVFLNLCLNAQDAMPDGGILEISSTDVSEDERLLELYPNASSDPYVVVEIQDSGEGIPKEDLERIFEPFFTTKERTGGTGLGLSIARGIVSKHDGYITVDSVVGKGTTFSVYLPAIKKQQK